MSLTSKKRWVSRILVNFNSPRRLVSRMTGKQLFYAMDPQPHGYPQSSEAWIFYYTFNITA